MKFEDYLLMQQPSEENPKIKDLQEEIEKLQKELDGELQVKRVLQSAMEGPVHSCSCSSSLLSSKVQMLLTELAMVEEEIIFFEKKVDGLELNLSEEKKQTKECEMVFLKQMQPTRDQWHWHKKQFSNSNQKFNQQIMVMEDNIGKTELYEKEEPLLVLQLISKAHLLKVPLVNQAVDLL